jgi:hypothetical protein
VRVVPGVSPVLSPQALWNFNPEEGLETYFGMSEAPLPGLSPRANVIYFDWLGGMMLTRQGLDESPARFSWPRRVALGDFSVAWRLLCRGVRTGGFFD